MTAPRQLVFRGSWVAAGLVFDSPVDEATRRSRVLAAWSPGATVYRIEPNAYLILWPQPQRLDAATAPGAVVISRNGRWLAAPLVDDETPPARANTLVHVIGGRVVEAELDSATIVDPSQWVDTGPVLVVEVVPLGAPPSPPVSALDPVKIDLRAAANVTSDQKKIDAVVQAFTDGRAPAAPGLETPAWRRTLYGWVQRLAEWLQTRGARAAAAGAREPAASDAPEAPPPRGPTWMQRWMGRLSTWLMGTGLGLVLGAWHQRYVQRVVEMFEAGNLQDALRHAIPIGGSTPSSGTALLPPSPRDRLEFGRGDGAAAGIVAADDTWERLRRFYRRAVQQLVELRRLKEAAFVLAELLNEREEAVAMLEREGEPQLAAELAETANLAPALRVRLWAQAGDWSRAARLARRHQAFPEAVNGLRGRSREAADKLNALWAAHCAQTGRYVHAVELSWAQGHANQAWIDEALKLGGTAAASMLGIQLQVDPNRFPDVRTRVEAILADQSPEGVEARTKLAHVLTAYPQAEGASVLARAVARAMIADQPRTRSARRQVSELLKVAKDPVLKADMPRWLPNTLPRQSTLTIEASDRGLAPIRDAVRLTTGKLLFALGEAGVLYTTADGRPLAHLRVPAEHLIPSDTGHRALALVERGNLMQIHRLDLVHRRATTWCEQPVVAFAPTFDGWRWFAALYPQNEVLMLDVTGERPEVEWTSKVHQPAMIRRGDGQMSVCYVDPDPTLATFDLKRLRLIGRGPVGRVGNDDDAAQTIFADMTAGGDLMLLRHAATRLNEDQDMVGHWRAIRHPSSMHRTLKLPELAKPTEARTLRGQFAVATQEEQTAAVRGYEWVSDAPWLHLQLRGAARARLRYCGSRLIVFDDLGRAVIISIEDRAVEHSLRLRL